MTPTEKVRRRSSADTLRRIAPLMDCSTERAGWVHCIEIARDLLDVDVAVAVEYLGNDRGSVRAGVGFDELMIGTVIPIPPGSQAQYALDAGMCVTGDLPSEQRFEPSPFLLSDGILSSMTIAFELPEGELAIIGVHSRRPNDFDQADADCFVSLGEVFGSAIRRLRTRDQLELNARIDPLTGLMNRASILQYLDDAFRTDDHISALLIDIDGFKSVNDTLGHQSGDSVLRTIAERIETSIGPGDRLGRLGGDEFLLISDGSDSVLLAERLIGHVEAVIMVESNVVQLSASVGIARRRNDDDAMGMIERADRLMYRAKSAGRGGIRRDATIRAADAEVSTRPSTDDAPPSEDDVDAAIHGLRVVVQPIIDPSTGQIHGVEALARGPVGHPLEMPDRLFPAATTFSRLGDLELAAKRLAFQLALDEGVRLYINLEPVLLCSESWLERLTEAWATMSPPPDITVELTERAVLQSPGRLVRAVEVCRALGWRIALDDVGARSESLAALRWIDPDVVKLDMSLISSENTAHTTHVVASIAAFQGASRRNHVKVIAEGVETLEDAQYADILGADLLQGFLFGRPSPIEDLRLGAHEHARSALPTPARNRGKRIATKRDLISMTRHVEASVKSSDTILLASIQHVDHVSDQTRRQYESLARRCGFVGIVGVGLSEIDEHRLSGVRLAEIEPGDAMAANWNVVSLSPTTSIALLATEIPHGGPEQIRDMDRLFRYEFVTDPDKVEGAARALLRYF